MRALRHRLGWRQVELAERAGVSQSLVSLIERSHIEAVSVRRLVTVLRALDADLVVLARWRGGDLDRLLDEAHATLVGATAGWLGAARWSVEIEVTYAIAYERGSIDLLGWHPSTATLAVVEVKSELVSIEETLRRHDAKARLASRIAADRFGWRPRAVARLLILPEGTTPRRRVARHDAVLRRAYPLRGLEARAWVAAPGTADGSLLFLASPDTNAARGRGGSPMRKRIRRGTASSARAGGPLDSPPAGPGSAGRDVAQAPTTRGVRRW